MRRWVVACALAAVAAIAVARVALGASGQVRLCHYTGDSKTPYVTIVLSASGAYHSHYPHHRDIIPPFVYKGRTYSRNWDAQGKATWNNACVPTPPSSGGGGGGSGGGSPPQVKASAVPGSPSFTG